MPVPVPNAYWFCIFNQQIKQQSIKKEKQQMELLIEIILTTCFTITIAFVCFCLYSQLNQGEKQR